MTLKIEIDMDNAAFENPEEIEDILRTIGKRITGYGDTSGKVFDSNGNVVGFFKTIKRRTAR